MLAISFDECPPRRRSVGPATRLPDRPPCRSHQHRQEQQASCPHRVAGAVAANVTIVRRAAVAMNVPVVPAEHRRHERGPGPCSSISGSLSGPFCGYFSSSVTLAAAAGAASTVTGVGSAFRIRFRTAACTEALYWPGSRSSNRNTPPWRVRAVRSPPGPLSTTGRSGSPRPESMTLPVRAFSLLAGSAPTDSQIRAGGSESPTASVARTSTGNRTPNGSFAESIRNS